MLWSKIVAWHHARGDAWFVPKMFGLGATPVTWQGWAMVLGFVALELALAISIHHPVWLKLLAILLPVIPFSLIVMAKTDGSWRFRFGPDSKD